MVLTIVHRDHCCDFLLMHKIGESVPEKCTTYSSHFAKGHSSVGEVVRENDRAASYCQELLPHQWPNFQKPDQNLTCSPAFRQEVSKDIEAKECNKVAFKERKRASKRERRINNEKNIEDLKKLSDARLWAEVLKRQH